MADFNQAIQKTLIHEGGYVNNPHDSGGATKYGITQRDMPNIDIRNLTQEQAVEYYREHYWKDLYSQIAYQLLAEKLFDMGVLMGVGTAVRLLQLTLKNKIAIVPDGVFGPETLTDINQRDGAELLGSYRVMLNQHCINIVNNNPNDSDFIQGWINRINS